MKFANSITDLRELIKNNYNLTIKAAHNQINYIMNRKNKEKENDIDR